MKIHLDETGYIDKCGNSIIIRRVEEDRIQFDICESGKSKAVMTIPLSALWFVMDDIGLKQPKYGK